jgi:hypothetical protein
MPPLLGFPRVATVGLLERSPKKGAMTAAEGLSLDAVQPTAGRL